MENKYSVIKASEVGEFLFCRRAWWYRRIGQPNQNQNTLDEGSHIHFEHGKQLALAKLLKGLAYMFFLLALVFLVISIMS